MTDYDLKHVDVRPAATVMLVDDRPDLQVFMMERHSGNLFAPGMWVFPGGAVDRDDDRVSAQSISFHRSDKEASSLLDLDSGGLAFFVAAIREAFEEAGILLALDKESLTGPDLLNQQTAARFQQHRDNLNNKGGDFIEILNQENLILDAGTMHYIARWITPVGPPKRFDARFFIAQMPDKQAPIHDDKELVHSRWMSPLTILKKFDAQEMELMVPTVRMIRNLAQFGSADEVISAAEANLPYHQAKVNAETNEIVMPGEPGYDSASNDIEAGWIRLRPIHG